MEYSVSTLKTNTIQAATGTTLNITSGHVLSQPGAVIQFESHRWNTQTDTTSASYVDVTGSSFNFTPKLATSKLYIQASCSMTLTRSDAAHYSAFKIVHDGTDIEAPGDRFEVGMSATGTTALNIYQRVHKTGYIDASNTNARAIKLQVALNATSNSAQTRFNVNNYFYSYIDVMEIAQ